MRRVAIIPARGGSKRLPRKNVFSLLGEPILAYPIRAALQSNLFEQVIVSTEDKEIADIARRAGAEVFMRPAELATDTSKVVQVCHHILKNFERDNCLPDEFCCIYATAFFVSSNDLKKSYALLNEDPAADVVMGVSDYNLQPLQALKKVGDYLVPMWPEFVVQQSQVHPELVASNGSLYWAKVNHFLVNCSFYNARLKGYVLPRSKVVDINNFEDFKFAEILAPYILGPGC